MLKLFDGIHKVGFWLISANALAGQTPVFNRLSTECGITHVAQFTRQYGHGAAAADFDKDGDTDFFLTTAAGIPGRLYQNDGKGYFKDIAEVSGITDTDANRAALWLDYDGDHRLDLVVAGENCPALICEDPIVLRLYHQEADFTFRETTLEAGLLLDDAFDDAPFFAVGGLSSGDLNGDQWQDLVLTVWGGGIKLFLNNGDGTFRDHTAAADLSMEEKTPWQTLLYDFNEDGLLDIYCNVDFAPNKLWINRGAVFSDSAAAYGLDVDFNEMGIATGDLDGDGDLDIYCTNISGTFQGQQRYNVLLEQKKTAGQTRFVETGLGRGVGESGWDWGTSIADLNNDGRMDLLTTNGWEDATYAHDRSRVWLNTSAGFVDISFAARFNDPFNATTLLCFDMDNDGDQDILQTLKEKATDLPLLIYQNTLNERPDPGNFLCIEPRMDGPNHFAIGAQLTLLAEDLKVSRLITAGNSFYGQEPQEAFFGLGPRANIEAVKVKWPNNKVAYYRDLPINEKIMLWYDHVPAPEQLDVELSGNQLTLRWEDVADNETGFELQISQDSLFHSFSRVVLEPNTVTYNPEIELSEKTFFRICAFNERVYSDFTNSVSVAPKESEWSGSEVEDLLVFPNPSTGLLKMLAGTESAGNWLLQLFDSKGGLLGAWKNVELSRREALELNLSRFSPGIYWLVLVGQEQNFHRKVILNHH